MRTIAIDKGDGWAVSDLLVPDDMAEELEKEYKDKKYKVLAIDNIW